jgi:hypothetical protein
MHDRKQRHGRGDHGPHGPGHGPHGSGHPGHHGPGHHDEGGLRGLGRHGLEPRCEGMGTYQTATREQTSAASDASASPAGEGCPKRGGTADCLGDCRTCPNGES